MSVSLTNCIIMKKNIEQELNKFKEALKESNGNEEKLLNELETEFRKYLGVV